MVRRRHEIDGIVDNMIDFPLYDPRWSITEEFWEEAKRRIPRDAKIFAVLMAQLYGLRNAREILTNLVEKEEE